MAGADLISNSVADAELPDGGVSDAGSLTDRTVVRWIECAWAVFAKDIRSELRTRYSLGTVSLFAITTLVMISAALNGAEAHVEVKAAMLWVVLLFAGLSGLARGFVREEELGTANMLRLGPPATAVYAGKLLFNLGLIAVVEVISVPLFLALLPVKIENVVLFAGVMIVGAAGLASASTFTAALISQATAGKSPLFTVVAFPVLLPLLFLCVQATEGALSPVLAYQARAASNIGMVGIYSVVMTTASLLLFEYVWHE